MATWGTGNVCATGTGPGLLMGADNWLGTPPPLDVAADSTGSLYSAGCTFGTDGDTYFNSSDLCPLDVQSAFLGAADGSPGSKAPQLMYIPVVNMPLPQATAALTGSSVSNGWITNVSDPTDVFTFTSSSYRLSLRANIYVPGVKNDILTERLLGARS